MEGQKIVKRKFDLYKREKNEEEKDKSRRREKERKKKKKNRRSLDQVTQRNSIEDEENAIQTYYWSSLGANILVF